MDGAVRKQVIVALLLITAFVFALILLAPNTLLTE